MDRRTQRLWSKPADYALNNPRVAELHAAMAQASAPPQPADAAAALQGLLPAATGQPAEPPPMLSPENRRAAIAAYANGLLAEQERLGVPEERRQVLPEDMAHDTVRDIAAGDPANADQRLRDLAADWGADWPRVLDDLKRAGLPAEYEVLAETANPVVRVTLARVLANQKSEPGALRAKTAPDAKEIDGRLLEVLVPLDKAVNMVRPTISEDRNGDAVDATAPPPPNIAKPVEARFDAGWEPRPIGAEAPLDHDRGTPQNSHSPRLSSTEIGAEADHSNLFEGKVDSDQSAVGHGAAQTAQADTHSHPIGNRRIAPVGPPRKPISPDELKQIRSTVPNAPPGADIDANIAEALRHKGSDFWFYNQVTNRGPWDYKRKARAFADFGNFNYGATGAAVGYTEAVLLRMAGWKQVDDKNSDPAWGVAPSKLEAALGVGGTAPFGDDPKDQLQISQGYKFFHAFYSKRRP